MEQFIFGQIRVQVLNARVVRVEQSGNGKFFDKDTFLIPNRKEVCDDDVCAMACDGGVAVGNYTICLPQNASDIADVKVVRDGKVVYVCGNTDNSGELPTLDKTPDVYAVADNPRIVVPQGGYSTERNGEYEIDEKSQDVYLLLCDGDFKLLRSLYVELTGRCEMPRLSTLGAWNSKYYPYTDKEALQVLADYDSHDYPLDNLVIDTDWRTDANGWGYDVNTKLFPDMQGFLAKVHAHNVDVMFNDHPEPFDGANVFADKEIAYRERNLQNLLGMGLDTWWYDRNWMTALVSPTSKIKCETLGMYLFYDITKHFYQRKANNNTIYRRPDIMANVDNIANGTYVAINSSASHRYPIQWTGDILSDEGDLAQEVHNLVKGGNNCIAYVNADCGGHGGNPDKEMFIRWMQFGTLSPVFRPHCMNGGLVRTREAWNYDDETVDIVRNYNNLRYRLLPVIYTQAHNCYVSGEPVFKALGWNYPSDKTALACNDEYMLGDNLLISPIAGIPPKVVAEQNYVTPVKTTYFDGTKLEGKPIFATEYKKIEMNLNNVAPEEQVPMYNFSARFETSVRFDKTVELVLRVDDGAKVWLDDELVLEDNSFHSALNHKLGVLQPDRTYKVRIDYFQGGAQAVAMLCYNEVAPQQIPSTYLPEGKWLDVFSGKVYDGNATVSRNYALGEMPLFVRMGAVVPLAYEAPNTKKQTWDKLVYDFYPYKDSCDSGALYEDDTETTAYKTGEYRTSTYAASYDNTADAYVLTLEASEGGFAGKKAFNSRKCTVKMHLTQQINKVVCVTVNGTQVLFTLHKCDKQAFPLSVCDGALDGDVVTAEFDTDVSQRYEIKFFVE